MVVKVAILAKTLASHHTFDWSTKCRCAYL